MDNLRYSAFSRNPAGGNPAGVVLEAGTAAYDEMLALAADLGYSEIAFLWPPGDHEFDVRHFSPLAGVPFCGRPLAAGPRPTANRPHRRQRGGRAAGGAAAECQ